MLQWFQEHQGKTELPVIRIKNKFALEGVEAVDGAFQSAPCTALCSGWPTGRAACGLLAVQRVAYRPCSVWLMAVQCVAY